MRGLCKEIHFVDGLVKVLGETKFVFSEPVRHGGDIESGHIILCTVEDDSGRFLFTSDVNGPAYDDTAPFIIRQNPEIIYLDGPVTYTPHADHQDPLNSQLDRLIDILSKTRTARIIIDHHVTRDMLWKEKMFPLFSYAMHRGIHIQTAAEYRGEVNQFLEASRDRLYEEEPPDPLSL